MLTNYRPVRAFGGDFINNKIISGFTKNTALMTDVVKKKQLVYDSFMETN